jgi:hypothetical protein
MNHEFLLSDLADAVTEKQFLRNTGTKDTWETVSYETAEVKGSLLIASEESFPPPVTLSVNLIGWHRIFVCMTDVGSPSRIDLKLTNDEFPTTMRAASLSPYAAWIPTENAEESFWKCADMTGQTVTVTKTNDGIPHTANLFYLRFVPMTEEEVEKYLQKYQNKTMLAHMDGDFHSADNAVTPKDFCKPFFAMKDSGVGIVCQEVTNDLIDLTADMTDYVPRRAGGMHRLAYSRRLSDGRNEIYPTQIAYAHQCGMKLFAGHRMQLSNFAFPLCQPLFTIPFVTQHPEFSCKARDGKTVGFLSYAYPQVQDFMIENILKSAQYGFDGIQLIFNRGRHLMFEEPVARRYAEKYGNTDDFYRLPMNDARLMGIYSDIMTEFLLRLRKATRDYAKANGKKALTIYLNAYFSLEDGLLDGFDLERFAKEDCIDGFIQTKMRIWEDTSDVLAPDGLIDLEKYAKKAENAVIYKRFHGSDMTRIVAGIPKMKEIAERFGLAFYSEIPWENSRPAEEFAQAAKNIYAAGGHHLALWDCYPARTGCLSEWACTANLGDRDAVLTEDIHPHSFHKIIKILSYGGEDVRYCNPSWRG